jgi:hypothetical protein
MGPYVRAALTILGMTSRAHDVLGCVNVFTVRPNMESMSLFVILVLMRTSSLIALHVINSGMVLSALWIVRSCAKPAQHCLINIVSNAIS